MNNDVKKYEFFKTCVDFEDGNEVFKIVQQDYSFYPEDTFFHNPELQITKDDFLKMITQETKIAFENIKFDFFGYNVQQGILFTYNEEKDIHYFFN